MGRGCCVSPRRILGLPWCSYLSLEQIAQLLPVFAGEVIAFCPAFVAETLPPFAAQTGANPTDTNE